MIEEKIASLASAMNRLAEAIEGMSPIITTDSLKVQNPVEPKSAVPPKKKAAKKKEPVVVEAEVEEAEVETHIAETPDNIPTVEEVQKILGSIAQKYGPVMVIAGIKHYGEGRLSDLTEIQRAELSITIKKMEQLLDKRPALVEGNSPADLYTMALELD